VNTKTRRAVRCGGLDTDPSLDLPPTDAFSDECFDLVFGFRRLAILDLSSAGHQPMRTPDGRYYIILNGEIYNYLELRAELEALGHTFRSHSDTEVLLNAYVRWGAAALNRLVGMFAFAVLDVHERMLFLARDFFGIKPCYYAYWRGGLAFASEIKALLDLPGVSRRVNPQRLHDYVRFGVTDHGAETLFAEVHQLPAAHYLEIPLSPTGQVRPVRYWQVDLSRRLNLTFEDAAHRLREMFLENIRLHLRSDVPVGVSFSGGIDSSSIVTVMRRLQGKELRLSTFSYIADDTALNEEGWVDLVTSETGATPYKVRPEPRDLLADLDELVYVQDEPFGSTSIYAQHRVFRLARDMGIKVMLDGQGADELLGGYPVYAGARMASLIRQWKWMAALRFFWQASRLAWIDGKRLLLGAGSFFVPAVFHNPLRRVVGKDLAATSLNTAWLAKHNVAVRRVERGPCRDFFRQRLYETLVDTNLPMLLRYEDRNSMAHSIESRVPFLTPALVNFVFALPEEYIIASDGTSKAVFRKAMRGIVPDSVLDRKDKVGFGRIPVLNVRALEQDWHGVVTGRKPFDFRIWRWVNLIRWTDRFEVSF
jgi:asparagine synthase (glutamine-hydrolysing)